jgi:hypothetical protein
MGAHSGSILKLPIWICDIGERKKSGCYQDSWPKQVQGSVAISRDGDIVGKLGHEGILKIADLNMVSLKCLLDTQVSVWWAIGSGGQICETVLWAG